MRSRWQCSCSYQSALETKTFYVGWEAEIRSSFCLTPLFLQKRWKALCIGRMDNVSEMFFSKLSSRKRPLSGYLCLSWLCHSLSLELEDVLLCFQRSVLCHFVEGMAGGNSLLILGVKWCCPCSERERERERVKDSSAKFGNACKLDLVESRSIKWSG
jgi:hypothetical protein